MKTYGLIGFPLTHSLSRLYFTEKFSKEGINAEYLNFELPDIGDLWEMIAEQPDLKGFNVTIPYKEQIIGYLDKISDEAREIGAVNTVKVVTGHDGPILCGYNTDAEGFWEAVRPVLRKDVSSAIILGSGGASKAVAYALRKAGIDPLIVSRSKNKSSFTYEDLTPDIIRQRPLIVNTTPLGTYPDVDTCPDIPYHALTPMNISFDLVYNPAETLFLKKAAEHGAVTKNGLDMLHKQADASWRIWQSHDS